MRKILFLAALFPLFAIAQEKTKPFKLSGKMKNLAYKPEWVFLQYRIKGEWKMDSIRTTDGKYSFSGQIVEPITGRLRVKYAVDEKGNKITNMPARDGAIVFLQPGKIKVTSIDSFSNIQVKGSDAHTEYVKLVSWNKPYDGQLTKLYDQHAEQRRNKDKEKLDKIEKEIEVVSAEKKDKVYGDYVKNNPASPIALYALQQYAGWEIDPDKVEPLYNTLSDVNKNYPSAALFREDIEIAKKTGIGRIAMDFTQNDTLGNPVMLSSLRGKYLLVDFWASWCGPCRAENPNIVRVFNKYKDRNFHILGVSLDRPGQKEKWMKAIHDDELTWTHVSDLKWWDNDVAKQYGIKAIPQNILLDPNGKIIAKNINGDELDLKVGEAIEGKKGF